MGLGERAESPDTFTASCAAARCTGLGRAPLPGAGPTRERSSVRERALRSGVASLSDEELLALLLGTGAAGRPASSVACALLAELGGLDRIERVGPYRLSEQRGIGRVKATRLLGAIELGRRVALRALSDDRALVGSFEAVAAWARPRLAGLDHEEVWLLCLDGKNGVRSTRRIGLGGLHGCALRPADVLRPALEDAASGIVLVHNHPSGDPTPSLADIELTRTLVEACQIVGLYLLDHVVVARSGAESLRELEMLGDGA